MDTTRTMQVLLVHIQANADRQGELLSGTASSIARQIACGAVATGEGQTSPGMRHALQAMAEADTKATELRLFAMLCRKMLAQYSGQREELR